MPGVGWRRLGNRTVMTTSVVAVIWLAGVGVYALVGTGGGSGGGGGMSAFNACIRRVPFLVLVRHGSRDKVIETIKDRARESVEGEVGIGAGTTTLGGASAGGGRDDMSTITPVGRDPGAIENCWDSVYPIAPGD